MLKKLRIGLCFGDRVSAADFRITDAQKLQERLLIPNGDHSQTNPKTGFDERIAFDARDGVLN